MKFMKLGSKPDQFQTDGDNIRLTYSCLLDFMWSVFVLVVAELFIALCS